MSYLHLTQWGHLEPIWIIHSLGWELEKYKLGWVHPIRGGDMSAFGCGVGDVSDLDTVLLDADG